MARLLRPLVLLALALVALPAAAATPVRLAHSGRLLRADDTPVNALVKLKFTLHTTNGEEQTIPDEVRWTGVYPAITVAGGLYAVELGSPPADALTTDVFSSNELWLAVSIDDGPDLKPRLRLSTVPWAVTARNALALEGKTLADLDLRYAKATGANYVELQAGPTVAQPGDAHLTGTVTARAFVGDGSGLTNLAASSFTGPIAASQLTGTLDASLLPVASASQAGIVSTGAQTFGGTKTFSDVAATGSVSVGSYLKLGVASAACSASIAGAMRYNPSSGQAELCNGASWTLLTPNLATSFATTACDAGTEGTLRYDPATKNMQFCNGTRWGNVSPDITPTPFAFTNRNAVARSTGITSNDVTVTGIDNATPVSALGAGSPMVSVAGGAFAPYGLINPGQTLAVRMTSASTFDTAASATVTVGTFSTTWTVTTATQDVTPDAFSFTDVPSATAGALTTAAPVTVSGIDDGVPVSVTGTGTPQISIAGGAWVPSGTINNGQTLAVRLNASSTAGQALSATVTVGSYSTTWTVTTATSLYAFTSHTFTNCGQTGRTGPALGACTSAYSSAPWAANTSYFDVVLGIQQWTVPQNGTYRIEAWGARGGVYSSAPANQGNGARMRGDFTLTRGQKIKILVGQAGTDYVSQAGGGGGTFVVNAQDNAPLLVAGGGGGGYSTASAPNQHGTISTMARTCGGGAAPATAGNGGVGYHAGGGGGLLSNGQSDPSAGVFTGGNAFLNGGLGGVNSAGSDGGFGGGGGSHSGANAGGGGGGYSGGSGGYSLWGVTTGAGGGSFNGGTNQSNTDGENVTGAPLHGQVIVTKL